MTEISNAKLRLSEHVFYDFSAFRLNLEKQYAHTMFIWLLGKKHSQIYNNCY